MVVNPDTVYIVGELIKKISAKIVVTAISGPDTDGYFTLETCNTHYLTPKSEIVLSGITYKVESIAINESIKISKLKDSNPDPTGTEIILGPPFYIHGSIISTKNELDKLTDWRDKYPMVYLYEIYRERLIVDNTSAVGYVPRVRLFFMDQTDPQNYTNATQYENVIRPMRSLLYEFIKVAENEGKIVAKLTANPELIPWTNFGAFESEKGTTAKLFSDNISGYELAIELPIKRSYIDNLECKNSFCCK